jgi:hypothetical protein
VGKRCDDVVVTPAPKAVAEQGIGHGLAKAGFPGEVVLPCWCLEGGRCSGGDLTSVRGGGASPELSRWHGEVQGACEGIWRPCFWA